ncbi:MAG: MBL fold metallo-hydrolase [Chitinivibrionales bacterium]|nr:MBL fold metallo-hydrolase [Chitinivibrionales bacterium]
MKIHPIHILGSNAYIIETENELYLIDAGYPGFEKRILKKVHSLEKKLRLIILTHAHFDHYKSAAAMRKATGALIGIHSLDADYLCQGTTPLDSVSILGLFGKLILPLAEKITKPPPTPPDILFEDNDSLDKYGLDAKIIHTPGHTSKIIRRQKVEKIPLTINE